MKLFMLLKSLVKKMAKKNKNNNTIFESLDKVDNSINKTIKKISIIFIVLLVLFIGAFVGFYCYTIMPVDVSSEEKIAFTVEQGDTVYQVLNKLDKAGLIRSSNFAKIYVKYNGIDNFYAGEYELSKAYPLDTILSILCGISNAKADTITVKFLEGKRIPYYAKAISEAFGYSEEEVLSTMNDKEYLSVLKDKYFFITDDILNGSLYYPLEGYLFPDTYEFNKDASIKDVIETMLTKMNSILSEYKDDIKVSPYGVHGLLTVASMVELEAVSAEDRALTAGVFYNRLAKGWTLGSDVTTYYDVKKDLTDSLTYTDLNTCNGYNTRGSSCRSGLPIGPIACVSKSSIKAAIKPVETKYMYFVADKNNKLYFAETESGHQQNIRDLKNQGLWLE